MNQKMILTYGLEFSLTNKYLKNDLNPSYSMR